MLLALRSLWEQASGTQAISDADVLALSDAALSILIGTPDDPLSLNDVATVVAILTPADTLSEVEAATLIALAGLDEPIGVADAATLVSLTSPNDAGNVADAATLIGLAVSESVAVADAINALIVVMGPDEGMAVADVPSVIALGTPTDSGTVTEAASIGLTDSEVISVTDAVVAPLVVVGPDEMAAVIDAAALVAVGTPNESITVSDAVVDIVQFQSVGPFDDIWAVLDEVFSILEIKPPAIPPSIPSGGAPSEDGRQIVKKPLPPLKVKKLALKYEPAPLTSKVPLPRIDNRQGQRMHVITRLMALHQMGLLSDDELEALSAAA